MLGLRLGSRNMFYGQLVDLVRESFSAPFGLMQVFFKAFEGSSGDLWGFFKVTLVFIASLGFFSFISFVFLSVMFRVLLRQLQGLFRQSFWLLQGSCRVSLGSIQGIFRDYLRYPWCFFRVHGVYLLQGLFRFLSGSLEYIQGIYMVSVSIIRFSLGNLKSIFRAPISIFMVLQNILDLWDLYCSFGAFLGLLQDSFTVPLGHVWGSCRASLQFVQGIFRAFV